MTSNTPNPNAPGTSRAAFLVPRSIDAGNNAFFFNTNVYLQLTNVTSGTNAQPVGSPPTGEIGWFFLSLQKAGFTTVDAVLATKNETQFYVFSGSKWALIDYKPGQDLLLSQGQISERFPALASLGFNAVDASFTIPGTPTNVYVFNGENYTRVYGLDPDNPGTETTAGVLAIKDNWQTLAAAGFKTVDAILPNANNPNNAWFFSGNQVIQSTVNWEHHDTAVDAAAKVTDQNWPALVQYQFY